MHSQLDDLFIVIVNVLIVKMQKKKPAIKSEEGLY